MREHLSGKYDTGLSILLAMQKPKFQKNTCFIFIEAICDKTDINFPFFCIELQAANGGISAGEQPRAKPPGSSEDG